MGRMSLIIVLGFIIIAGITYISINESNMRSVEQTVNNSYSLDRNFSAHDIITYAIQQKVLYNQSINTSDSSWINCLANVQFTDLNPTEDYPFDSLRFTATSTIDGVEKEIEAIVLTKDRSIPILYSPLVIHANQAGIKLEGPSYINGGDVNLDDTFGTDPDKYGVTLTHADSTLLKGLLGDDTLKIQGLGSEPSLNKNESYHEDIAKYVDLYKAYADTSITTGILPGGTYGSEANPVIVHADGSTIMSGNVTGTGILAIDGSFSTTDSACLTWNGLVIVSAPQDSANTYLYFADSSSVHGSVIVGAPTKAGVNLKGEKVTFEIYDNKIIPGQEFLTSIHILGSELSGSGGRYDAQSMVKVHIGGHVAKTWHDARYSDNDARKDGKRQPPINSFFWQDKKSYPAGTEITVSVKFYSNDFYPRLSIKTISSTSNSDHLKTLRNGDAKPGMQGSSSQSNVEDFLEGYITNGQITISDNQAIFLFDYNNMTTPFPYDNYTEFREAHDDHWDPYYQDKNPEYEDYIALYGETNEHYNNYNQFLALWIDDGIWPDGSVSEHNVETEDFEEAKVEWYNQYDNRDFQDCCVLADLAVPEDDPDDTLLIAIDTLSQDKTVKLQNSEEANDIVRNLIKSRIGSGRTIVKVDWWDGSERKNSN